jgi:hypothetical protein
MPSYRKISILPNLILLIPYAIPKTGKASTYVMHTYPVPWNKIKFTECSKYLFLLKKFHLRIDLGIVYEYIKTKLLVEIILHIHRGNKSIEFILIHVQSIDFRFASDYLIPYPCKASRYVNQNELFIFLCEKVEIFFSK